MLVARRAGLPCPLSFRRLDLGEDGGGLSSAELLREFQRFVKRQMKRSPAVGIRIWRTLPGLRLGSRAQAVNGFGRAA